MVRLFALVIVLFLILFDFRAVTAFEFPQTSIFAPFPSFRPFPTGTPVPTRAPSPSPMPAASGTPVPTSAPATLKIEDVDPSSANFLQEFTIYGTNFGTTPGNISFRLYNNLLSSGGVPIVSWSDTEIVAKVPGVRKGSYRIQVITSDSKKSNEVKFSVKNGQPMVNTTSLHQLNNEYELIFQGSEFGFRRGSIDIYLGPDLVGNGIIESWSSSRVRFTIPNIPYQEYGFQLTTSDGRKSSLKFFTVGN